MLVLLDYFSSCMYSLVLKYSLLICYKSYFVCTLTILLGTLIFEIFRKTEKVDICTSYGSKE